MLHPNLLDWMCSITARSERLAGSAIFKMAANIAATLVTSKQNELISDERITMPPQRGLNFEGSSDVDILRNNGAASDERNAHPTQTPNITQAQSTASNSLNQGGEGGENGGLVAAEAATKSSAVSWHTVPASVASADDAEVTCNHSEPFSVDVDSLAKRLSGSVYERLALQAKIYNDTRLNRDPPPVEVSFAAMQLPACVQQVILPLIEMLLVIVLYFLKLSDDYLKEMTLYFVLYNDFVLYNKFVR